jgi:methyl-accepting chemotaxis protein
VVANITGQFFINLGLKLSDNVDQLFSGAGQMAAASAAQVISSQVEQTAGKVDANSSAILTLNNSVKDINTALNNKADASALQSLTTRVSNAEGRSHPKATPSPSSPTTCRRRTARSRLTLARLAA